MNKALSFRVLGALGIFLVSGLMCQKAVAQNVDYDHDIAPIFQASCVKCHGAGVAMGKLRLDSEAAVLKGGVSGPVIVPGKSGDSLLVKRILGQLGKPRMPMGGAPLSDQQVQLIRAWIDQGASSPNASSPDTK